METRNGRVLQGPLAFILTFALVWGLIPAPGIAWAQDTYSNAVVTGTYTYKTTLESNFCQSTFTYRDDCFCRSSFLGCTHLIELSMELASASGFSKTVLPMLSAMGFSDVEANAYLAKGVTTEDSMGVAVGRRTITDAAGTHTLLAVVPRSDAYGTEWVSNMTVGTSGIHEGFKASRDEVLRFIKAYVAHHNVTGDIKLWLCGHSRGAAVATLVAGFFAEGGTPYLDRSVTLSPENIYCYATATPTNVRTSATLAEALSVAGSRAGTDDTEATPYVSTATGTVNPHGPKTRGIYNYVSDDDIVAKLLPEGWDYARYGCDRAVSYDGVVSRDEMLEELAQYNQSAYTRYVAADPRTFSWRTLDIPNVSLNDLKLESLPFVAAATDHGAPTLDAIERRLMDGLTVACPTSEAYVSSATQDTLGAVLGLVSSGALKKIQNSGVDLAPLLRAVLFAHVDYAGTRLGKSGESKDAETLSELIRQLTGALTGIEATTVDDLLRAVGKLVADKEDSPLVTSVAERVTSLIPAAYEATLRGVFITYYPTGQVPGTVGDDTESYVVDPGTGGTGASGTVDDFEALTDQEREALGALVSALVSAAAGEGDATSADVVSLTGMDESATTTPSTSALIANFLKVMYAGIKPGAGQYDPTEDSEQSAARVRGFIYTVLSFAGGTVGIPSDVVSEIYVSQGQVSDAKLLGALMPKICGGYKTMSQASSALFAQAANDMAKAVPEAKPYLDVIGTNAPALMGFLNDTLFSGIGGTYDLRYTVDILSTLATQYMDLAVCHFPEINVCWARVLNRKDPTIHGGIPGVGTIPGSSGTTPGTLPTPGSTQVPYAGSSQARYTGSSYSSYTGASYAYTGTTTATTTTTTTRARRLAGADRYQTMREIVSAGFASSECAVLAVGTNYPDALAASALAGALGAPVVLTDGATLSDAARAELERLGVRRVSVAGGEAAVGEGVIEALRSMGLEVERVAGGDRVATSVEMMRAVRDAGSTSDTVVVVSGVGFADALSIGPWAYATKSPVLLAGEDGLLGEEALDAIRADPLVRRVVVVGGAAAVGDVEGQLRGSYEVLRLAGADRFETSAKVAAWASAHGLGWRRPAVATGLTFPDALAGAAYAGHAGNVMLLVGEDATAALGAISEHRASVTSIDVLGGEGAVSPSVASELERALS